MDAPSAPRSKWSTAAAATCACTYLQVLHYVEKPGTFVSSIVNAGAYLFTPDIFVYLSQVFKKNHDNELM